MRSWFSRPLARSKRRAAKPLGNTAAEQLEQRTLLTGDVRIVTSDGAVRLIGDEFDNSVKIFRNTGGVWAEGLDTTTINGSSGAFRITANDAPLLAALRADLKDGNDTLVISPGTEFDRAVRVLGGKGNDQLLCVGATFHENLVFHGHQGEDEFSGVDSQFRRSLVIDGGADDDLVSITDSTSGPGTLIRTSLGDDLISLSGVTATGRVQIDAGFGNDSMVVSESTFSGTVLFIGRRGQDAARIQDSTFHRPLTLRGGIENDAFEITGENTFDHIFRINGGKNRPDFTGDISGTDQYQIDPASVFNGPKRITRVESDELAPGIADRFDDVANGVTAQADALDQEARDLAINEVALTVTGSADQSFTDAGGVIVTRSDQLTLSGTTIPGAEISVDTDEDGVFDNGTVIADASGNYTLDVTLTRADLYAKVSGNDELTGRRSIALQATTGPDVGTAAVQVDYVTGTVVEFVSSLGTWNLELFDDVAPGTTQNFLNYVDVQAGQSAGRYTNSIIHRSVQDFVIQGGGFTVENGVLDSVPLDASVTSEFSADRGNIRGTISMAHAGDPDVLTSQWFVNTIDNPSLDDFSGRQHTVFGRLVGSSQTVVDAIASLERNDISLITNSSALGEVPLTGPLTEFSRLLSGTVSTNANSTLVTGVDTKFTDELKGSLFGLRSRIQINDQTFYVASIDSDTQLTVTNAPTFSVSDFAALTDFVDDDFVQFTTVRRVLT